ncbi:MAG TPA: hypothetical protein VLK89_01160 [Solirubrobacterales bacterium]|nr:hypothetical protein [Solirubrobacterales bacterium]
MTTKARIVLTAALGIVMGVSTWLGADGAHWASEVFFASAVLLSLIVGRWWVVAALAGPFIALVALDSTGHVYEGGSDPIDSSLLMGIVGLFFWEVVMLILVGIRKVFDFLRNRRVTAIS